MRSGYVRGPLSQRLWRTGSASTHRTSCEDDSCHRRAHPPTLATLARPGRWNYLGWRNRNAERRNKQPEVNAPGHQRDFPKPSASGFPGTRGPPACRPHARWRVTSRQNLSLSIPRLARGQELDLRPTRPSAHPPVLPKARHRSPAPQRPPDLHSRAPESRRPPTFPSLLPQALHPAARSPSSHGPAPVRLLCQ